MKCRRETGAAADRTKGLGKERDGMSGWRVHVSELERAKKGSGEHRMHER